MKYVPGERRLTNENVTRRLSPGQIVLTPSPTGCEPEAPRTMPVVVLINMPK
jgi:hypothetical protein